MENQRAGVAESGRRKGLKISRDSRDSNDLHGNTPPVDPTENPASPGVLETSAEVVSRAEVLRRLEMLAAARPGGPIPDFLATPNNWGESLSALAAHAAEIIRRGTDPRIEMESGDVVKICGIRYSMGLFHHIGFGPTNQFYQIVERRQDGLAIIRVFVSEHSEIDRRLFDALQRAGRSALGFPGTVDTFKGMLADAGLAVVLA